MPCKKCRDVIKKFIKMEKTKLSATGYMFLNLKTSINNTR